MHSCWSSSYFWVLFWCFIMSMICSPSYTVVYNSHTDSQIIPSNRWVPFNQSFWKSFRGILATLGFFLSLFLIFTWYYNFFPWQLSDITISNGKQKIVFLQMSHIATHKFYETKQDTIQKSLKLSPIFLLEWVQSWTDESQDKFNKAIGMQFDRESVSSTCYSGRTRSTEWGIPDEWYSRWSYHKCRYDYGWDCFLYEYWDAHVTITAKWDKYNQRTCSDWRTSTTRAYFLSRLFLEHSWIGVSSIWTWFSSSDCLETRQRYLISFWPREIRDGWFCPRKSRQKYGNYVWGPAFSMSIWIPQGVW